MIYPMEVFHRNMVEVFVPSNKVKVLTQSSFYMTGLCHSMNYISMKFHVMGHPLIIIIIGKHHTMEGLFWCLAFSRPAW